MAGPDNAGLLAHPASRQGPLNLTAAYSELQNLLLDAPGVTGARHTNWTVRTAYGRTGFWC